MRLRPIYLDYNATTPIDKEVFDAMLPFLTEEFGNPSSSHLYGEEPRRAIEQARTETAGLIGADPSCIFFTGGGTESDNHAIIGFSRAWKKQGRHIITCTTEHPAVIESCKAIEKEGFNITFLPVDETGRIRIPNLESAIRPDTILITIMHANNEIGTLQPIKEISATARKHGIVVHTDAAQSLGKIPVDVHELGVDLLTVAGHKLYAPKGVGALYVRDMLVPGKLLHGGGQERGMRPGTENVAFIVGLGAACRIAARDLKKNNEAMRRTRDLLHRLVADTCDVRLNGHPELRIPNTLNISFRHAEASVLLAEISEEVAASAGSACHSGIVSISPVISALGVPEEWAPGAIRFSTGRYTTDEDIESAAGAVSRAYMKTRW